MKYNWNMPLLPGTIVLAKYNRFDGMLTDGIFCVLYDEQLDQNVFTKKNIVAVKLSTRLTTVSNYTVQVDMDKNTFLKNPSVVCCSKTHTLHKEQQVYGILGTLDPHTYTKVYKNYLRFINEITRQVVDKL